MRRSLSGGDGTNKFDVEDVASAPMAATEPKTQAASVEPNPKRVPPPAQSDPTGLHAVISRGANIGAILLPHVQNGAYIVSRSRFETDYIRVPLDEPLEPWLVLGCKLRMSVAGHAPSLIAPASIRGRGRTA